MSTTDQTTTDTTDDGRPTAPTPRSRPQRPPGAHPRMTNAFVEDVLEALKDVVDPELGINVVDLGLIYGVTVDANRAAAIDMTLTSAACPLTDMIEDQTSAALEGLRHRPHDQLGVDAAVGSGQDH